MFERRPGKKVRCNLFSGTTCWKGSGGAVSRCVAETYLRESASSATSVLSMVFRGARADVRAPKWIRRCGTSTSDMAEIAN